MVVETTTPPTVVELLVNECINELLLGTKGFAADLRP